MENNEALKKVESIYKEIAETDKSLCDGFLRISIETLPILSFPQSLSGNPEYHPLFGKEG